MAIAAEEHHASTVSKRSFRVALLHAVRPRQWPKNLLVFAAPGAAGVLVHPGGLARAAAACVIFIAVSAGTYLLNDVVDVAEDRMHPTKRFRPIASNEISTRVALMMSVLLIAVGIASAALLAGVGLTAVVCAYVLITTAYCLRLKKVAVIEFACVSSGFVLRAVAGGAAVHVGISPWFLIVTSFSALMVVAGKRSAEMELLGDRKAAHRITLGLYPPAFLRTTRMLSATVTVTAYCLWAFERAAYLGHRTRSDLLWFELSIVPFVLAVLVLELLLERGRGGAPEELALRDRTLQSLGVAWLVLLAIGIYS